MTITTEPQRATQPAKPPATRRRRSGVADRGANRLFRYLTTGSGVLILIALAAVAGFLLWQAWPAFTTGSDELATKVSFLQGEGSLLAYLGPLVFGTVLAAVLALAIATPLAIGIALFTSHYAPRRLAQVLGYVVDLLAAIPSVVYGLWGALVLAPLVQPIWGWVSDVLGWIPLFAGPAADPARVLLTVAVILAVMILPIITAVTREVFLQTPKLHEEAALALGATRWEMIRTAVLPFGRSGIVSAAMLGLGRALGETMAVVMILSPGLTYSFALLLAGKQQTIAANIALKYPEANELGMSTLMATGLALFVITMVVNMLSRWIVARRKDFSGAN
ncbi:phosphate ABC transporter permease subunit PstC [Luteimicrobium subarcticum]|uniref:Phosphate transport system permease protein n=1 Tax=Luteimicrobium subarcticum TaxID=620910 RepID=A0A2M8WSQ6_9MICO|nr:phosphate ABC transporter permease subunit PstC [Luteimicrobium subarcticum]PJI93963.1 phosphate ABC transporter membrane protein 1 (PhoT family) [Luteimicrobium subarcticum]